MKFEHNKEISYAYCIHEIIHDKTRSSLAVMRRSLNMHTDRINHPTDLVGIIEKTIGKAK